jgi:hypothetical protein
MNVPYEKVQAGRLEKKSSAGLFSVCVASQQVFLMKTMW